MQSILFIGNSYTFRNDMSTELFEKMARSAGYDLKVSFVGALDENRLNIFKKDVSKIL